MEEKRPINHEWDKYYRYLFELQDSGRTNMWGAALYLVEETDVHYNLAKTILLSWMDNWDELKEYFNGKRR